MAQQGYGSRWRRWLLIYAGIAIVAYAVIYFAFFHSGSGSGGGGLYLLGALPGAELFAGTTSRRRRLRFCGPSLRGAFSALLEVGNSRL